MATTINDIYTVSEVAEIMGISPSRIRQICIEHDIGTVLGKTRVFTKSELKRLQDVPRTIGRPRKES